jgi:hypothetical protein
MMTDSAISELLDENFTTRRPRSGKNHRAATPVFQPRTPAASRPRMRAKAQVVPNRPRLRANIFPKIFSIAVVMALWVGWLYRDDSGLTPVSGAGYWLGIAGSSLMLLLVLYPLRKRVRSLRAFGTVTFWFNAHMILGILGPVLILWHANFRLGSINCSVALVTTLLVTVSGIIGRYLHSKVHFGMYGRKAEAQQIVADADELRGFIGAGAPVADRMVAELNAFANFSTTAPKSVLGGLVLLPVIGWRGAILRARLIARARQAIAVEGKRRGRPQAVRRQQLDGAADFVTQRIGAARKAATFAFCERLFGLWHVFHVPLFVLLVIVALFHVLASHFY